MIPILEWLYDNRGWISSIILALMVGYVLGNPNHIDIIFEQPDYTEED